MFHEMLEEDDLKALQDENSLKIYVSHIYREGNNMTDKLASLSTVPNSFN